MKNSKTIRSSYHLKHRTHQVFMFSALSCALISLMVFSLIFIQSAVASSEVTMHQEIVPSQSIAAIASQTIDTQSFILAQPLSEGAPAQFTISLQGALGEVGDLTVTDTYPVQNRIPIIHNAQPTFYGSVGDPGAKIFLEIHSSKSLSTVFDTSDDGTWSWAVPQPLEPGEHVLYIVMLDSQARQVVGQAALRFIYVPSGEAGAVTAQAPLPDDPVSPSDFDKGNILFDVRVSVPDRYKSVRPGEDLLAEFRLVNIATEGQPVDVTLRYRIIDRLNSVVLDESETIAVSVQQSFLKTFRTGLKLPAGTYRLEVELPYNDGRQSAYSSDTFEVQGTPVISFSGGVKLNVNMVLQALGLLLTIFCLVAYYEFKQVESLARIIHQISEEDLLRQQLID